MSRPRQYNHDLIVEIATEHPTWTYRRIAREVKLRTGKTPSARTVKRVATDAGLHRRERLLALEVDAEHLRDQVARLQRDLQAAQDARRRAEEQRDCLAQESANKRRAARRALSEAERVTGFDPRRLLELIGAIVWAEQDAADYDATVTDGTYLGALCEVPLRPDDVRAIREGYGIVGQWVDRHLTVEWERNGGQTACKKRLKASGVTGRERLVTMAEIERDAWIAARVDEQRWPWGPKWPRS